MCKVRVCVCIFENQPSHCDSFNGVLQSEKVETALVFSLPILNNMIHMVSMPQLTPDKLKLLLRKFKKNTTTKPGNSLIMKDHRTVEKTDIGQDFFLVQSTIKIGL